MKFIVYLRHPKGTRGREYLDAFDSGEAHNRVQKRYPGAKITRVHNTGIPSHAR